MDGRLKGRLGKTASGISGTYEIVESMVMNMKKGTSMNMKMKKEAGTIYIYELIRNFDDVEEQASSRRGGCSARMHWSRLV